MYETYLQNEREFEEKFPGSLLNMCLHKDIIEEDVTDEVKSHNLLSLIKVMKALEKELEGEKKQEVQTIYYDDTDIPNPDKSILFKENVGFNQALNLSLDKIREFISKLEKEV